MNSVSSSAAFTASSILSGKVDIPASAKQNQEGAPIASEDVLVKSEKEDAALKKPSFFHVDDSKNPFKKLTEKDIKAAKIGAGIGAAAGGIAGGIAAYNMSWNEIKATNEVNSVSLDWKEPVMVRENLGQIPSDYYQNAGWFGIGHGGGGLENVYRDNPVMEGGKPVMQDVNKTFSNYGEPVVTWKDNPITQKTLEGFHESVVPDYDTYQVYEGTDSDGNAIYSTYEEIDGYYHNFSPKIGTTNVGNYQSPEVKFETGVNVGLNTAIGILAGAGIGAIAGGIAGAAISHVTNKE